MRIPDARRATLHQTARASRGTLEVVDERPTLGVGCGLAVIVAMLAVDLLGHRSAHVVSVREAAAWSGLWVSLGVGFGCVIWWTSGAQASGEYYAGYLIEKSLAVDNVFVFALIFGYVAHP